MNNKRVRIRNGKTEFLEIGEKSILLGPSDFNKRIKNLANNSTSMTDNSIDETVKTIGFYSLGKLLDSYTKESLEELANASLLSNNKIKSYYDGNGNIYIYSENEIVANQSGYWMFRKFTKLEK